MNSLETAQILRFVHALCPAQRMDEFTPDAWELVLGDVPFDEAKAALKVLGQQLRFIAPADIAGEVRRARATRPSFPPGTGHLALETDIAAVDRSVDAAGYIRALRAKRERIGGPPVAFGAAVAVERTYVHVPSKWSRSATTALPERSAVPTLEAAPDAAYEAARAVLARIHDTGPWLAAAVVALAAEGDEQPTPPRIAIRAAGIAEQARKPA